MIEHTVHSSTSVRQSGDGAEGSERVLGSASDQLAINTIARGRGNYELVSGDLLGLNSNDPPARVMSPTPCMYLDDLKVLCTHCRGEVERPAMCNDCGIVGHHQCLGIQEIWGFYICGTCAP